MCSVHKIGLAFETHCNIVCALMSDEVVWYVAGPPGRGGRGAEGGVRGGRVRVVAGVGGSLTLPLLPLLFLLLALVTLVLQLLTQMRHFHPEEIRSRGLTLLTCTQRGRMCSLFCTRPRNA